MTGDESRRIKVGDRVCWDADKNDQGTITEKNWAGVPPKIRLPGLAISKRRRSLTGLA
jgi:hypothetical protein